MFWRRNARNSSSISSHLHKYAMKKNIPRISSRHLTSEIRPCYWSVMHTQKRYCYYSPRSMVPVVQVWTHQSNFSRGGLMNERTVWKRILTTEENLKQKVAFSWVWLSTNRSHNWDALLLLASEWTASRLGRIPTCSRSIKKLEKRVMASKEWYQDICRTGAKDPVSSMSWNK